MKQSTFGKIMTRYREKYGLQQKALCKGICDVTTLSKIENGYYGVRRDTYRKLMSKMGRIGESATLFALISMVGCWKIELDGSVLIKSMITRMRSNFCKG